MQDAYFPNFLMVTNKLCTVDGKAGGKKTESGPTKAEIAVSFLEELEKGRNKSKKHTLNDLIAQKRQATSEDKKK